MPDSYTIVAGPQAAGKSTLLSRLKESSRDTYLLRESRQIIVHKHGRRGAIHMTKADEIEVIGHDMQRMFRILHGEALSCDVFDETNVFTLSHARAHGIDLLDGFFHQYTAMLCGLNARVLFIDVPPNVSWERRRARYEQRLRGESPNDRDSGLERCRQYLFDLHPELIAMYSRLEIPKSIVDGTTSGESVFQEAVAALDQFTSTGHCSGA